MRYVTKLFIFCGPVLFFYNDVLNVLWVSYVAGGSSLKLVSLYAMLFFMLSNIFDIIFISHRNVFNLSEFSFDNKSVLKIFIQFLINIFFICVVFFLKIQGLDLSKGKYLIVLFAFFISESFVYFFRIFVHFLKYKR